LGKQIYQSDIAQYWVAKEQNDFRAAENVEPTGQTAPLAECYLSIRAVSLYDYIGAIDDITIFYRALLIIYFYTSWGFMVYYV
jgi:hypothetical protein